MKKFEITIQGTTPLLCNRFTDEDAASATKGTSSSLTGDRGTPLEQAAKGLYPSVTSKKKIIPIIPVPNLFRCILDAGKFFKAGKSKVTTLKASLIPACLEIFGSEVLIKHREPWTIDTRAVRIPATGGRILRHRPCFFDWELSFGAELDISIIGANLFREIVDSAGKRIGLGDFRPNTKGPFGKFVVTKWKAIK